MIGLDQNENPFEQDMQLFVCLILGIKSFSVGGVYVN